MSDRLYDGYDVFMRTLPVLFAESESFRGLAYALGRALSDTAQYIKNTNIIYADLENANVGICDIVARDMGLPWYAQDYPDGIKRKLAASGANVLKTTGTAGSLKTALLDTCAAAEVEEWTEYNGTAGHFRVTAETDNEAQQLPNDEIFRAVELYKRLSSVFDGLIMTQKGVDIKIKQAAVSSPELIEERVI